MDHDISACSIRISTYRSCKIHCFPVLCKSLLCRRVAPDPCVGAHLGRLRWRNWSSTLSLSLGYKLVYTTSAVIYTSTQSFPSWLIGGFRMV